MNPQTPTNAPPELQLPSSPQTPQMSEDKPTSKRSWRGFFSLLQLVAIVIGIALLLQSFIFQSYQVIGQSMEPTLSQGDYLIISRVGKTWHSVFGDGYIPNRRDIIVFDSPIQDGKRLIKRVIGLPGERVVVSNGTITVYNDENPNGFVPDSTLDLGFTDGLVDIDVPEDEVFVVGDNRGIGGSLDSRSLEIGAIPIDLIKGKLSLRLLPLSEAQSF